MFKRKASDEDEDTFSNKFSKQEDSDDDEDDDDSTDGKKYEILKEDDIEGQEAGEITNEGDVQITPFNMKEEMEEGHFDSEGMYHWNKETDIRDNWLENIDWVKLKEPDSKAAAKQESESEDELEFDKIKIYEQILQYMKPEETVAAALRRLGGMKSLSASERLKMKKAGIVIDKNNTRDDEAVTKLTELANSILTNLGNMDIYEESFEQISEEVKRKSSKNTEAQAKGVPDLDMYADDFDTKEKAGLNAVAGTSKSDEQPEEKKNSETDIQWEYKKKLSDEKTEGPYSTNQMNKWIHEDYFKTPVWVRKVGTDSEFYSSKRIDFELYL